MEKRKHVQSKLVLDSFRRSQNSKCANPAGSSLNEDTSGIQLWVAILIVRGKVSYYLKSGRSLCQFHSTGDKCDVVEWKMQKQTGSCCRFICREPDYDSLGSLFTWPAWFAVSEFLCIDQMSTKFTSVCPAKWFGHTIYMKCTPIQGFLS